MWGFIFYEELPDWLSITGYVIIIGSAIYKWYYVQKKDAKEAS